MASETSLPEEPLITNPPFGTPLPRWPTNVSDIKRIVLDVLKPHRPSIVEMSQKLTSIKGVDGVNCTLDEVDQETESVRITLEGPGIDFERVEQTLRESGAVIHSVDSVSVGKKLVEDVRIPQNR